MKFSRAHVQSRSTPGTHSSAASRCALMEDSSNHAVCISFSNAKAREDVREQIFRRATAADFLERLARICQVGKDEFFRHRAAFREGGRPRPSERTVRALYQRDMTNVGDG